MVTQPSHAFPCGPAHACIPLRTATRARRTMPHAATHAGRILLRTATHAGRMLRGPKCSVLHQACLVSCLPAGQLKASGNNVFDYIASMVLAVQASVEEMGLWAGIVVAQHTLFSATDSVR